MAKASATAAASSPRRCSRVQMKRTTTSGSQGVIVAARRAGSSPNHGSTRFTTAVETEPRDAAITRCTRASARDQDDRDRELGLAGLAGGLACVPGRRLPSFTRSSCQRETPVACCQRLPLDTAHECEPNDGVLVVGESLVDIVHRADGSTETFPGGSAANVAVALARLGRDTGFVTSFAEDEHGRLIAEHLAESGVRLEVDPHVVPRTSSALATLQADGSARYTFDIDWRIGPVEVSDPPLALHACSLGAVLTPGCDDVRALMARLRGVEHHVLRRQHATQRHRGRSGDRQDGRGDGGAERHRQGLRRGSRGALPRRVRGRGGRSPASARSGGRRGHPRRRRGRVVRRGPRRRRARGGRVGGRHDRCGRHLRRGHARRARLPRPARRWGRRAFVA